jgi:carboxypeptidase C (cathepsin A)
MTRAPAWGLGWAALGLALLAAPARAEAPDPAACQPSAVAVTHHQIRQNGHVLPYEARAGLLPIRDGQTGELRGCVFFVAYVGQRATAAPVRPLSFLWNGGPGANSILLHLEAFGPRRIASGQDPTRPEPAPLTLEDNAATLLDQSDLVFVDPVGTGFSRPARPDAGGEFYNVLGDSASIAEFVRVYRNRFEAEDAPLFLVGESYGVWRAASVAEALATGGAKVSGLVLISGGIPVGPVLAPEMKTALFIPQRAAAAFYFHKLSPDLQEDFDGAVGATEIWARTVYAPALAHPEALSNEDREAIAVQLARFTGLPPARIDRTTLVVPRRMIAEELLAPKHERLGALDVRVTTPERDSSARVTLVERYLRQGLGFDDDLPYLGLGDDGYTPVQDKGRRLGAEAQWAYNQGDAPGAVHTIAPDKLAHPVAAAAYAAAMDGPPGGSQPWLTRAMATQPGLRVFVAAGWYDSLNSCAGNAYVVDHLMGPAASDVTARCYRSGHMIYRDRVPRFALRADLRRFYDAAAGPQTNDHDRRGGPLGAAKP